MSQSVADSDFGLDDFLAKAKGIRESNRRLSARLDKAADLNILAKFSRNKGPYSKPSTSRGLKLARGERIKRKASSSPPVRIGPKKMEQFDERLASMEESVDENLKSVNSKLDLLINKVATCDDLAKLDDKIEDFKSNQETCLLYTSPSPRD